MLSSNTHYPNLLHHWIYGVALIVTGGFGPNAEGAKICMQILDGMRLTKL